MERFIVVPFILVIFVWLYLKGFLITKTMASAVFVRKPAFVNGIPCLGAKFSYANGKLKRVATLKSGKEYVFELASDIKSGSVSAEISHGNDEVIHLNKSNPSAIILAQSGLYSVKVMLENANGEFALTWKEA